MAKRPSDEARLAEPAALRLILRRLRETMAETDDGQSRLDKIVRHIAGLMVAEVCSIYLKRQDGSLELVATEGLNRSAVHATFMRRGEGLVGRCAELAIPINEPEAQAHPAFAYRPETGEEVYHSFLAVPILRGGDVLGVLTVQNRTRREYSDEDVEALQTTAMVLAEHVVSGAVAGLGTQAAQDRVQSTVVKAQPISEGLALGHVVLHEPRIVVTQLTTEDPEAEQARLDAALAELKATLDELIDQGDLARDGEHRDVLEAYRMFARDRGWQRRLGEAVAAGLTADAAVEQVQNQSRARMLRQADPFWRERLRDLDDLSDRLLRILAGQKPGGLARTELPPDTVLVARTMGAAELLDYDRSRLRGLIIEDGSGQSHVAIVARALGIAAVGQAHGIMERVERGSPIILDAESGEIYLRPTPGVIAAFSDKARFRARRQSKYESLRERPAITRDGERVQLMINAGLQVDLGHLAAAGADGIGLFRTELQFMIAPSIPRLDHQIQAYRSVMADAKGKPVVFRTLDIGSDKELSYLTHEPEDNPALGLRGIRLSLDRPALLRTQLRALVRAAAPEELRIMLPMVSDRSEISAVRSLLERELEYAHKRNQPVPRRIHFGIMVEVPSILFDLDGVLPLVDFVSVGSNDLQQYVFATDRTNNRVWSRYDPLSPAFLRAMKLVVDAARRHDVPVAICGEMGGRPLDAVALIGIGFRTLSMSPAGIGPVKAMVLSLDAGRATEHMTRLLDGAGSASMRDELRRFCENEGVEI
jgi:phosphotransferase system, enzyme I, PtsP